MTRCEEKEIESKTKTTYAVVMAHVRVHTDKTVDVNGVFTPQCYADWLASRAQTLKKPEKAFYRAFLTHMRGSNNRKPFPPKVEEAFLIELRKPVNVWDQMFLPNDHKVGKFGFTHIAFHESKSTGVTEFTPNRKKRQLAEDPLDLICADDIVLENHLMVEAWKDVMELGTTESESHLFFNSTPWDCFWEGVKGHESFMYKFEDFLKRDGYDAFSPALIYLMKQTPSNDDIRFNLDFLFPKTTTFAEDRPIGYLRTDVLRGKIIDCNNDARDLLCDEPIGKHFMNYVPSMLEFWVGQIDCFQEYEKDTPKWKRVLIQDRNGKKGLYLAKVRMPIANYQHEIFFQDISEYFPEYLSKPFFI